MENPGSILSSEFFTFKYPGREPKLIKKFLSERLDVLDYYIYDIDLTTGSLLYSCRGGIGVTKERYVVDIHSALQSPTFSAALREKYNKVFGTNPTKRKYLVLRDNFNKSLGFSLTRQDCVDLYLLWSSSGFLHKYRDKGYDAMYLPQIPKYTEIKSASVISGQKRLLFRKEDVFTMSEGIINDNVVVYMHIPDSYGMYGAGFLWTEKKLRSTIEILKEFDFLGYKVCISATLTKYGRPYRDYSGLFNNFSRIEVSGFKGSELTTESSFSEIYFLNF
jgi:hypothetical protein